MGRGRLDILKNIRVLEIADETGWFCGRLLADLGADVIKVEPHAGDPSESHKHLQDADSDNDRNNFSFIYDNLNKRSVALDPQTGEGKGAFRKLIKTADVLIATFPTSYSENLHLILNEVHGHHPKLIHLSITPFGLIGPKRNYAASSVVASAAGGQMFVCRDETGKPSALYGNQPYRIAGLCGAVSVLLHLIGRSRTGRGGSMDISLQEAVASSLDQVMVDYLGGERPGYHPDPDFRILPAADGYIQISILRNWETLVEMLALEGLAAELTKPEWKDPVFRRNHCERAVEIIRSWTVRHTKQELFELGQGMAFPWAPVAEPSEVRGSPQLRARNFFFRTGTAPEGPRVSLPASPYVIAALPGRPFSPAPRPGQHTEDILKEVGSGERTPEPSPDRTNNVDGVHGGVLKGLRVLDLTRMLSGPYCTRILGDFGAEVLKIQTARTALGAESNKSTYFRTWNRNKRGICLNLDTPEAQELFLKLAAESDIVVENYSPRIMANWDLRYERLSKVNDSLVMLSLSAMGQSGPWANFVGFAPTFHALSGLSSLSSLADSGYGWINIGHAYGDTVAGLYGALAVLAALIRRGETGKGCHIDLSCYEALCTLAGPALMRKENTGTPDPVRSSFTLLGPFPDGCYPCSGDDDWCAITIRSDEEWARFCRITGDGELAKKKFAARSARHRNRVELDRRICAWTSNRTAESVERELQQAGIAAHKVLNAHDLARDPQLSARSFYTGIQHCIPGEWTFDRSAVWPYRCDHEAWHAAPALGEANHDVFVKRLGMTEDRFRDYIDRGIIG